MEISYKQKLNMRKFWNYTTTLKGYQNGTTWQGDNVIT